MEPHWEIIAIMELLLYTTKKMFDRAVTTLHLTVCLFVWLFVFMFVSEHWFQLNAIYNSNIRYFWSDELVKLAAPSRTSQGGLRHSSVHSACSYRAELVFVRCCCRAHRVCVGATFFYVKSRTLKLFSFEWNFSVHFDRERKKTSTLLCMLLSVISEWKLCSEKFINFVNFD